MRTEIYMLKRVNVEEFADDYALSMCVNELYPNGSLEAYFGHDDEGSVLTAPGVPTVVGLGATPAGAVADYLKKVNCTRLVVYDGDYRVPKIFIPVPVLEV